MPKGWVLDLSRLVSRAGRRPLSGVDRVELAWCRHLADADEPTFGLIRTRLGHILTDARGLRRVAEAADDAANAATLLKDLRAMALARVPRFGRLSRAFARVPEGSVYLNLAHSNLTHRVMKAVHGRPMRAFVFLHDAIPLDLPDLQARWAPARMRRVLEVASLADGQIFASDAARAMVAEHLAPVPGQINVIAGLGPGLPEGPIVPASDPPYFVMIGTIEPRKGHDFIVSLWKSLINDPPPGGVPELKIFGSRGWASPWLFEQLEGLAATGHVSLVHDASDDVVRDSLAASSGLLFPSLAEGFGLPALEATKQGVPALCTPLPAFREVLGDIVVYLDQNDLYRWRETIIRLMDKEEQRAERTRIEGEVSRRALPTWDSHFNAVLRVIG